MGGAQTILDALRDAVGPDGTILGYTDWDGQDDVEDHPELREHARPFDPLTSRSVRDVGFFPELLRTTPGALRSRSMVGFPALSMPV